MTSTDNVYDKAREVLRERGWARVQSLALYDGGPACLHTALCLAEGVPLNYWTPSAEAVVAIVRAEFPDRNPLSDTAWQFNDHMDTTEAEVDMVLDKAGRLEDEQAGLR